MFGPCFLMQCLSRSAISLMGKRDLVAFLLLSSLCLVTVSVLWLILTVPLVGLQCVIVLFPDYTHTLCSHALFGKSNQILSSQELKSYSPWVWC